MSTSEPVPGLDVNELARIANELFSQLARPGAGYAGGAVPGSGFTAQAPSVPSAPSVPPVGQILAQAPVSDAALPAAVPVGFPSSPSPFGPAPRDVVPALVTPESLGLPGEAELASLLGTAPSSPQWSGSSASAPSFYFLEQARPAAGGVKVPNTLVSEVSPGSLGARPAFDANLFRRDFPILQERVAGGKQLVWLDNAATTQKPRVVIDRLKHFYEHENSNVHRAAHELAARSTDAYEGARERVREFLNARSANECVFVRGATEAINLVAQSWGRANVGGGDEIVVSHLEHHANIVPWQQLAAEKGAKLRVAPVDDSGQILLDEYAKLLGPRTKIVAFTLVSNALGTVTPAREMTALAKAAGAKVLLDGAQAVSHMRVDVQSLGADWLAFSGHKVFGPTGIGVLWGREELLNQTPPWQGGGNMIKDVTFEKTSYHPAPGRFEAGTGNIADAVGLGAALEYVMRIGIDAIGAWEHQLLLYGERVLSAIPGVHLVGTAADKAGVLSFVLDGFKTEDVGVALGKEGVAVRSGHHCAQPILRRFGLEATVRPSLAFYNTCADLDALASAVQRIRAGAAPSIAVPALR